MHDGRFKTLDEVIDFYSEGLHASPYIHPLMHKIADEAHCSHPKKTTTQSLFTKFNRH
jgi:cytochrome c peroxidase